MKFSGLGAERHRYERLNCGRTVTSMWLFYRHTRNRSIPRTVEKIVSEIADLETCPRKRSMCQWGKAQVEIFWGNVLWTKHCHGVSPVCDALSCKTNGQKECHWCFWSTESTLCGIPWNQIDSTKTRLYDLVLGTSKYCSPATPGRKWCSQMEILFAVLCRAVCLRFCKGSPFFPLWDVYLCCPMERVFSSVFSEFYNLSSHPRWR